jgi:subtilase family serine protease
VAVRQSIGPVVPVLPDLTPEIMIFKDKDCKNVVLGNYESPGAATLYVRFWVRNIGKGKAGAFRSMGKVTSNGAELGKKTHDVNELAPGMGSPFPTLEVKLDAAVNNVEVYCVADEMTSLAETDEKNNKKIRQFVITCQN